MAKLTIAMISQMVDDVDTLDCLVNAVRTHNTNAEGVIPCTKASFALSRLKRIVDELQKIEVKIRA